jgi:DNA polymerase-3 subunit delta'
VKAGTQPHLHLIHRQLNRQHPDSTIRRRMALRLSVEVIRHFLNDRVGMRPVGGRAKVFIVREAERMSEAAQNSLLKTLEEPPPDTFLILLTDALDRMLPTTRSRCQLVRFQALPDAFVAESLKGLRPEAADEAVAYASRHSQGRLGLALRDLDDGLYELKRQWGERLLEMLSPRRGFSPHSLAKPFMEDAKGLARFVSERDPDASEADAMRAGLVTLLGAIADFHIDALRRRTGSGLPLINADQADVVERLSEHESAEALLDRMQAVSEAESDLGMNAHVELTIESLFVRLARAHRQRIAV